MLDTSLGQLERELCSNVTGSDHPERTYVDITTQRKNCQLQISNLKINKA